MSSTRGDINAVVALYAENTTPELPQRKNKKPLNGQEYYNQNEDENSEDPYVPTSYYNEPERPESYLTPLSHSPDSPPAFNTSSKRSPQPPLPNTEPYDRPRPQNHPQPEIETLHIEEEIRLPLNHASSNISRNAQISQRSNYGNAVTPTKEATPKESDDMDDQDTLQYSIQDTPPWYLCIFLGLQHYLVMFGATVSNPLALAPSLCISPNDHEVKSQFMSTILFCSGMATLLQSTIGTRLPIVQGGSFTYVIPSLAILSLDQWADCKNDQICSSTALLANNTNGTTDDGCISEPLWKPRIREIQGAIMVAAVFQVVIGFSGVIGFIMRFIGPLTIAPTIALAGLALFDVASAYASKQWWITLATVFLIAMFSQYTKNIGVPCCKYERGHGLVRISFPLFRLFPIILAIAITWLLCLILTVAGVVPDGFRSWGYENQTDLSVGVLEASPWFRLPYPGQWGLPTVSAAGVFGMLSGVLASMVESIGDYYACARISKAPPPPMHAVNRGIGMEGIGCILAGAFGSGSGTTSYSENIGAIGITKVASRRVIQIAAIIMLLCGVFGKFGAMFVAIPVPIIGGIFIVMFGMITAVGMSNLQFVDLNSSRNLFIIGFSFFFGLTLPKYLQANKDAISTGNVILNQILTVLLRTNMFVGGISGFVLDNTIPGTKKERGLIKWRLQLIKKKKSRKGAAGADEIAEEQRAIYDIPILTKYLKKYSIMRFVPFLPTFDEELFKIRANFIKKKKKGKMSVNRNDSGGNNNDDTTV